MAEMMDLVEDAMLAAVEQGLVTAVCSGCKVSLTPEQHDERVCPRCGPLVEEGKGDPSPIYVTPN